MKRYLITEGLKQAIRDNKYSMREMSTILGFEVKNIYCKNISIREDHLQKLNSFLKINFNQKEIVFDFIKNLGHYAFTKPIKKVNKSEDLAELIGIMLGDGNMWHTSIRIAFDKRNKIYIDYVEKLFYRIFDIPLKKITINSTNQAYLYCCNKLASQRLLDFGLKRGDKIKNNVGIPKWINENINYTRACLRGLIDTDGCIYKCKREKQMYIKFTNFNSTLLKDFKDLTVLMEYHFARANKNNWCLYRKEEVVRFIKEIKPLKYNGVVG